MSDTTQLNTRDAWAILHVLDRWSIEYSALRSCPECKQHRGVGHVPNCKWAYLFTLAREAVDLDAKEE